MRGAITLTIISIALLVVSAKNDEDDMKKVETDGHKTSESNIRETAVFAPQRLKDGRSPSQSDNNKEASTGSSDHGGGGGEISTSQTQHSAIVQVQEIHENDGHRKDDEHVPQSYKFGYEVKDQHHGHQFRHEQKDPHGTIHGRFGYRDKEGQFRQVDYVADDYGFRANVKTNEFGVENQNPAHVDIEKHQEDVHLRPSPPAAPQSKVTEYPSKSHAEHYHKSEEEEDDDDVVVPHRDSSAHSDSSHEHDYEEEENHEEPQQQKSYQRGSETGHHPITLRPKEKYSYQRQMQIQPAYHQSHPAEERYTKSSLGYRPSYYDEERRAGPGHHASQKKDDYHLLNKGKASTAIISRHFYKKHLTHHQHVIQHPLPKFKKDSHESPKSVHYQQLSRGLSARVVPSSPVKHQQYPLGDASYENSGGDASHNGRQRETYRDAPQHYVQEDHPDSHEKQHDNAYGHQIQYVPREEYHSHHPNHNENSGEEEYRAHHPNHNDGSGEQEYRAHHPNHNGDSGEQ